MHSANRILTTNHVLSFPLSKKVAELPVGLSVLNRRAQSEESQLMSW